MISIGSGDATVSVDADHGGRLAGLDVAGRQMLLGRAPERGPMQWGSFPMVPWAGRVRRGQFVFGGRQHDLPLDLPPHAIHGTAYRQRWYVESVADDELSMSCELDWELGGRAWQRIEVDDTRLTCVLGVAAGDDAMPAEIGWHPWFSKPESLSFRPSSMYVRDGDGIARQVGGDQVRVVVRRRHEPAPSPRRSRARRDDLLAILSALSPDRAMPIDGPN